MPVVSMKMKPGSGRLTTHGKRMVAESMYAKGATFIGASILLHRQKGYEFVVLHLLCQGVEIVLKGLLLIRNYDKFKPKLKNIGHNLEKLASTAVKEFHVRPLPPSLSDEIRTLNGLYSSHRLRYGSFYDVLVDPRKIPRDLVMMKIAAVIKLVHRQGILKRDAT